VKNITITTRLVDTVTTPMLPMTMPSAKLDERRPVTRRVALADGMTAHDTFDIAAKRRVLKVAPRA
jgi:alcohol dehydrogenase